MKAELIRLQNKINSGSDEPWHGTENADSFGALSVVTKDGVLMKEYIFTVPECVYSRETDVVIKKIVKLINDNL